MPRHKKCDRMEKGEKDFLLFMRNVFWTIDIVLPPGRRNETQNSIYLCSEIKLQQKERKNEIGKKLFNVLSSTSKKNYFFCARDAIELHFHLKWKPFERKKYILRWQFILEEVLLSVTHIYVWMILCSSCKLTILRNFLEIFSMNGFRNFQ